MAEGRTFKCRRGESENVRRMVVNNMAKAKVEIKVDTKDIDRIAIGSRLYDAFDNECIWNMLHTTGEKVNDVPVLGIKESDIIKLLQQVNRKNMFYDVTYVVIKD